MCKCGEKGLHIPIPAPVTLKQKPPKLGILHQPGLLTPIKGQAAFQLHPDFPAQFEMALPHSLFPSWGQAWGGPIGLLRCPGSPPSFWSPPLSSPAPMYSQAEAPVPMPMSVSAHGINPCIWYRLKKLRRYGSYLLWSIMSVWCVTPRMKGEIVYRRCPHLGA